MGEWGQQAHMGVGYRGNYGGLLFHFQFLFFWVLDLSKHQRAPVNATVTYVHGAPTWVHAWSHDKLQHE